MTQNVRITAAEATALTEKSLTDDEDDLLEWCYTEIGRAAKAGLRILTLIYIPKPNDPGEAIAAILRKDGFEVDTTYRPSLCASSGRCLQITWPNIDYPFPEGD